MGWVESRDWLVGQQDLRLDGERPGQEDAHALARREGRLGAVGEVCHIGKPHGSSNGDLIGIFQSSEGAPMWQRPSATISDTRIGQPTPAPFLC